MGFCPGPDSSVGWWGVFQQLPFSLSNLLQERVMYTSGYETAFHYTCDPPRTGQDFRGAPEHTSVDHADARPGYR